MKYFPSDDTKKSFYLQPACEHLAVRLEVELLAVLLQPPGQHLAIRLEVILLAFHLQQIQIQIIPAKSDVFTLPARGR